MTQAPESQETTPDPFSALLFCFLSFLVDHAAAYSRGFAAPFEKVYS